MSHRGPRRSAQQGAALAISLVLLAVLTLLAVAALRLGSLGILMAGNRQFAEQAFQRAESGNAMLFERIATGQLVPRPGHDLEEPASLPGVLTKLEWMGTARITPLYGTDFCRYFWILTSTGTSARHAQATHHQGIWLIGTPDGCTG